MDPITIGTAVVTALDAESVAKSINWVFSAVDHFLKIRKNAESMDSPIDPPASATSVNETNQKQKSKLDETVSKPSHSPMNTRIKLVDLDKFVADQLASEVTSLMSQLEIYLGNLRFEEEKIAQFGGPQFAPPIEMNTVRVQRDEIAKRILRLNACMQKAYGVSASNLEAMIEATHSSQI